MRILTHTEACDFLTSLNVHPAECEADKDGWFEFVDIMIDRDGFDDELSIFCADLGIDLDKSKFEYSTSSLDDAPIEALVVRFPYSEDK